MIAVCTISVIVHCNTRGTGGTWPPPVLVPVMTSTEAVVPVLFVAVRSSDEFDTAFAAMMRERPDAFTMTADYLHQLPSDGSSRSHLPRATTGCRSWRLGFTIER